MRTREQQAEHEATREQKLWEAGYNPNGTRNAMGRLLDNKHFNAFANNLALPSLEVLSYADGIGELGVLYREAKLAKAAATAENNINRIYSARELMRRAEEIGPYHNFPESFNNTIFSQGSPTITPNFFRVPKPNLSNTNILYELPGSINGKNGIFQIGVRPSLSGRTELIIHRFFKPIP